MVYGLTGFKYHSIKCIYIIDFQRAEATSLAECVDTYKDFYSSSQ